MTINQKKIQHLYWRAGFGITPQELDEVKNDPVEKLVKRLFVNAMSYRPILMDQEFSVSRDDYKKASKEKKQIYRQQAKLKIRNLAYAWTEKMAFSKASLQEKMTLFWHGHFASDSLFPMPLQKQNNLIRENALFNFRKLLFAVSKDPVMIYYLNNQQNKKGKPNENFAREVMELFTLGIGNYTEQDIKEAARAFTGWSASLDGEFVFKKEEHDGGVKIFMGKTGNFTGDDILNMLLDNKQTAKYITRKIYKYFVNEHVNEEIVSNLADTFFNSDYDINSLMFTIFKSDWFYDKENIGTKIKSPIELIAGLMKTFSVQFKEVKQFLMIEKVLGQQLFNPPNVAGWPGGKTWIDSSTLTVRLRLAEYLFKGANLEIVAKKQFFEEGDEQSNSEDAAGKKPDSALSIFFGMAEFTALFAAVNEDELFNKLSSYLLQSEPSVPKDHIEKYCIKSSKEEFIQSLCVRLLSLPEYQLC